MFHGHLDYFQKPPLGGRPNTKPGDHGALNAQNSWFILFYHVWGPAWRENHWNSIWSRAWFYMISHYAWGFVTTLHDFGGVLGRPLDTFFWALTISWSRLLGCVWTHTIYMYHISRSLCCPAFLHFAYDTSLQCLPQSLWNNGLQWWGDNLATTAMFSVVYRLGVVIIQVWSWKFMVWRYL